MPPRETLSSSAGPRSPQKGFFSRFVLPLILLMLIVGGIAWVAQYLPNTRTIEKKTSSAVRDKPLIAFERQLASWETDAAGDMIASKNFKEFEPGMKGYYDFPFRSDSDEDAEIVLESTGCDCSSILACILPEKEWNRVKEAQDKNPGSPLPYAEEPTWTDLSADRINKIHFPVKPKDLGIVRVQWTARKAPGQDLNLQAQLWSQPAGNAAPRMPHRFFIASSMVAPVRFSPARVNVGVLTPQGTAKAEFDAWSPTRGKLDLKLTGPMPDPLFEVELRELSSQERAQLEYRFVVKDNITQKSRFTTRVLSAYHVTVTVHEQKGDRQLDQGSFYRKLPVFLDGFLSPELPGPEIVGRVHGGIEIGGADDQGRIKFKSFSAKEGASKVVELVADANLRLEPHSQHPAILEVHLTPTPKSPGRWRLKVTVPPNSFSGSFTDADAVTLRIAGEPPRFIRIPIDGNVSGR